MDQRWETGRVEAFSDGVFAIAITLLVLEIQIPTERFDDLWDAVLDAWPSYLAYVTSFFTVGGVWIAHHRLFARLRSVDPPLMRLNLLLLLVAAFLPFPTGLLAEAFDVSREAERAAVVVYGATALAIEVCIAAAWRHAATHPELLHGAGPMPRHARRGFLNALFYAVAIAVAVVLFPRAAAVAYLLVATRAALLPAGEGPLKLQVTALRASGRPRR